MIKRLLLGHSSTGFVIWKSEVFGNFAAVGSVLNKAEGLDRSVASIKLRTNFPETWVFKEFLARQVILCLILLHLANVNQTISQCCQCIDNSNSFAEFVIVLNDDNSRIIWYGQVGATCYGIGRRTALGCECRSISDVIHKTYH
uniref:Secreted protein n=1 Tax=Heterorhabditis bacteriophora TaxID=37862 RepID=A0A1I7WS58_HETBA